MSVAQRMRLLVDVDNTTPQATPKNDLYQGDKNANQIVLEMMRGGEKVNLQGYSASASMERSDGTQVPCTGEVTGSTVTITLNEHCYVFAGPYTLDIELSGGSDGLRRTVAQITGTVRKTASGPVVEMEEEIVDVDAVLALYAEMKQAKDDANSAATEANNAAASANSAAQSANTIAQTVENKLDAGDFKGEKGDTGSTPNITFHVATGEPGTQVQISQSGTAENPVVDLTIPRGDTGAVDGLDYFAGNPSALGTASPGTANGVARGDHVHPMPTAEQVGARAADWMPTAENVGALAVDGTAADSAMLGGKLPSDYVTKDDNRTQIHLRWENGSLDSKFEASTVEIDLSDAIGVFINFIVSKGASTYVSSGFIPKINTNHSVFYFTSSGQRNARNARVNNSGVVFGASTTDGSTGSSDNIIPHRIYAVYRVVSTDVPLEDQ